MWYVGAAGLALVPSLRIRMPVCAVCNVRTLTCGCAELDIGRGMVLGAGGCRTGPTLPTNG